MVMLPQKAQKHIIMTNEEKVEVVIEDQDLTDVVDLTEEELADDKTDYKAKYLESQGIAKRRTTALKKAKEALGKNTPAPKTPAAEANKSNELDYGQKAFLVASGYKEADEQTLIQEAMTQTGKKLEEVLAMPFVVGQIDDLRKGKATTEATPKRGDRTNAPVRDTVEYWLNKGELPPADQRELRQKVVNAKIAKAKEGNRFTDNAVVGQ